MPHSVDIRCTDPLHIGFVWELVRGRIGKVLRDNPSDTTLYATEHDVLSGLQLLWVAWRGLDAVGAATTSICKTPARKLCTVVVGFGDDRELWKSFFPIIERYARNEGCSNLRFSGRRGWKRVMTDFREPWIVLDKELI